MCGLVGIAGGPAAPEERARLAARMAESLVHRGPDGSGSKSDDDCAFGFRRLAIVDLGAVSPPYTDESGDIWSQANAEIYNSAELTADLEARGHRLRTRVDTEILSHLYEEQGVELVSALNGMFAFAIWDAPRRRLVLARDRAGEKPLFWWHRDGETVFASELRALMAHPRVAAEVDPVALQQFLLHGFFPAPRSPIAGVHKLPAGHRLVAEGGGVTVEAYWDLADHFDDARSAGRRLSDLAAEVDERIGLAVERRSRADVPVGVFLSGGIDSTTVLAHLADQRGAGVPAFSLGNADAAFDESGFARTTARRYDADFHELILGESDLEDGLSRVAEGFDEPLADASIIPTHLLSLFARQHVKVVLSGEGADELFGGYPTYLGHRVARGYQRLPSAVRRGAVGFLKRCLPVSMGNVGADYLLERFAAAAGRGLVERHHSWFGCLEPERIHRVLSPEWIERLGDADPLAAARGRLAGRRLPDDLARVLYSDFTLYLQDGLLTKVDRATMLASLEARAPFLDHDLAEFVAGLPSNRKVSRFTTKAVLRRAVRRRIPRDVLSRRKRGFNIPFSRWLLHGLGDSMRERFAEDRVRGRGVFTPEAVTELLDEHLEKRADHRKPLFALLVFDLWCDRLFGESGRVPLASGALDGSTEQAVSA